MNPIFIAVLDAAETNRNPQMAQMTQMRGGGDPPQRLVD
jgi:hypothetical protein